MKIPRVRGIRRRIRVLRYRVVSATLAEGALTRHLLNKHCTGLGAEVGPGRRRKGNPERTITFDRFAVFNGVVGDVDVRADGAALPVKDGAFDYVISAHTLEHVPDTLSYLREWLRVIKPGGCLLLVLPHVDRTFDHGRPVSTLEHHLAEEGLVNDPERPLHWDEWERRLLRDQPAWLARPGARRCDGSIDPRYVAEHAYIHYHCWTQHEMTTIVQHLGCTILAVLDFMPDRSDSFLVLARKGPQ